MNRFLSSTIWMAFAIPASAADPADRVLINGGTVTKLTSGSTKPSKLGQHQR